MAHTAHYATFGVSILHVLAAPFNAIGRGLIAIAEANSRQDQVAYLESLSDEELAKRGLTRDGIADARLPRLRRFLRSAKQTCKFDERAALAVLSLSWHRAALQRRLILSYERPNSHLDRS